MPWRERAPEWVLFDCFDTLLVEPDRTGLAPIEALPVEAGFYPSAAAFRADYDAWCRRAWPSEHWPEVLLPERLAEVLAARAPQRRAEVPALVGRMVARFEAEYPKTLRPAEGVVEMLDAWSGRARLGVVSNFFLPDLPEAYLAHFGLRPYFEFVLDSGRLGWKKPGERFFREALRRARAEDPDRVLVIGDHLRNDVHAPRALGMRSVHLCRGEPSDGGVASIRAWREFRPPPSR